jgi:hypothetical protein
MSDERLTIEETIAGDSWWITAIIEHLSPPHHYSILGNIWQATEQPKLGGDPWNEPLDLSRWEVAVRRDEASATIRVTAPAEQMKAWRWRIEQVRRIARAAQHHHRRVTGSKFEQILDDYYEIKARGGSPNLREMAVARGVKEGSLRQAKIRYDEQRRKRSISGETNISYETNIE